jgi:hypothetical protein
MITRGDLAHEHIQPRTYHLLVCGEKVNDASAQEYPYDFANGWICGRAGILGVSQDFINEYFHAQSLDRVKLMILKSSDGNSLPQFITAGASSVIFCNGVIPSQFGLTEDLTDALVTYLTAGESVLTSVYNTVSPFNQGQQLERQVGLNLHAAIPFHRQRFVNALTFPSIRSSE